MKPIFREICVVSRYGTEVFRGTYIECVRYILSKHPESVAFACAHEGYSIQPTEPAP